MNFQFDTDARDVLRQWREEGYTFVLGYYFVASSAHIVLFFRSRDKIATGITIFAEEADDQQSYYRDKCFRLILQYCFFNSFNLDRCIITIMFQKRYVCVEGTI